MVAWGKGMWGAKNLSFELLIYAYPENLAQIRLLVSKLVKGGGGGFRGDLEEDRGGGLISSHFFG